MLLVRLQTYCLDRNLDSGFSPAFQNRLRKTRGKGRIIATVFVYCIFFDCSPSSFRDREACGSNLYFQDRSFEFSEKFTDRKRKKELHPANGYDLEIPTISNPIWDSDRAFNQGAIRRESEIVKEYERQNRFLRTRYPKCLSENYDTVCGNEHSLHSSIQYYRKGMVSIRLRHFYFMGGAHPLEDFSWYTFDFSTGKELDISRLFENSDHTLDYMEKKFRESLRCDPHKAELLSNDRYVSFKHAGLSSSGIVFELGEVFSHAEGNISLALPWSEAWGLFGEEYRLKILE